MPKDYHRAVLLDCYGAMLTNKQALFMDCYYNQDLSLSEIAQNEGITRQAVRDAIQHAEQQLDELENKLGLCRTVDTLESALRLIEQTALTLPDSEQKNSIVALAQAVREE